MLPKQAILEYQEAYKKQWGTVIPYEVAAKQAEELLGLYKAVYQPIKKEWLKEKKNKK